MPVQTIAALLCLAPVAFAMSGRDAALTTPTPSSSLLPTSSAPALRAIAPVLAQEPGAAPSRLQTLDVASGPTSNFDQAGTHVIRSDDEWEEFWKHLPTQQDPPDIDFERVTLLAVVLAPEPDAHMVPRIDDARGRGTDLVVRWRGVKDKRPENIARDVALRPFVVVGIMDYGGPVVFEQRR